MMGEHYFTGEPTSRSRTAVAVWEHGGREIEFLTDSGVFSRGHVDYGSRVLVEALPALRGRVLDMGCGYGFVGLAAKLLHPGIDVCLCDVNTRAVALARRNAEALELAADIFVSDGFAAVAGCFDFILTNPPVRAGKSVYYPWFEAAAEHLRPGGALFVVLQRKQGAPSTQRRLEELFSRVEIVTKSAGYHVLRAEK